MDRRRFISTTFLSGVALASVTGRARAFSEQDCADAPGTPACRELLRHHELLAQLEASLEKKGLDAQQRKAVLAAAVCPFCGQPLIG